MRAYIIAALTNFLDIFLRAQAKYETFDYSSDYATNQKGAVYSGHPKSPRGSGGMDASMTNRVYGYYSSSGYENYQHTNQYPIQTGSKYQFKCYTCEEKDPMSDCAQGRLYPDAYPSIECPGYCYVMSYTLFGTESRTTQRSCSPHGSCTMKTNMCLSSYVGCTFNCCDSDFCNSSSKPAPLFNHFSSIRTFILLVIHYTVSRLCTALSS